MERAEIGSGIGAGLVMFTASVISQKLKIRGHGVKDICILQHFHKQPSEESRQQIKSKIQILNQIFFKEDQELDLCEFMTTNCQIDPWFCEEAGAGLKKPPGINLWLEQESKNQTWDRPGSAIRIGIES